ncbi:SDR family NAD(P)-dependent oxidoreductase [Caldimonas sp. KR1-144]|uniref:SDR family NAD(P)-dependent oxidoreductase n=1 Tax=Caldimonas sp. KR1-144 TaxID=3400911 RepID=UPI003BFD7BFF
MAANPRLKQWAGRVAWVVGASSGIGRATASMLHAQGAKVAVSARQAGALEAFVRDHPGSCSLPLDVCDATALRSAARQLLARHGRIDLAMYCAGHYRPMRAQHFDAAEMSRHLDVNYLGAVRWLDALLPTLIAQGDGHLSLVASVAGYRGLPQALAYGPSKAALLHLAQTLYIDLAPQGLGVSVINPGFVDTPLTAQNDFAMPALITPEEAARHILRGWARGRFEIHFPWRFTVPLKLLGLLPHRLYVAAVRRSTGI